MASTLILKSVYDAYLSSDYEWGDDNLNPKREIKLSPLQALDDDMSAIIQVVQERLKEIKKSLKSEKQFTTTKVDNDDFTVATQGMPTNATPSPDDSVEHMAILSALGGSPTGNIFIPTTNQDDAFKAIESQIEDLMIQLAAMGVLPDSESSPISDIPYDTLYNPGCGEYDTEGNMVDEYGNIIVDGQYEDVTKSGDAGEGIDYTNVDGEITINTDSSSSSSDNGDESSNISVSASSAADLDMAQATSLSNESASQRDLDAKQCAQKSLGILQSVNALLKTIKSIKQAVMLALAIASPIIKAVTFASQCWINPPAASEVVELAIDTAEAIAVQAVCMALQALWDLLNLDCKTAQVMSIINEIRQTLAGFSSLLKLTNNLISMSIATVADIGGSFMSSVDNFKSGIDSVEDAFKSIVNNADFSISSSFNSALSDFGESTLSELNSMLDTLVPSEVASAIEGLRSAKDTKSSVINSIKSLGGSVTGKTTIFGKEVEVVSNKAKSVAQHQATFIEIFDEAKSRG